jgi:hypothetical protein
MDLTGPDPEGGGGQVYYVSAGSIADAHGNRGPRSAIAVTKDERSITVSAGPDGLQILVMQYPRCH